MRTFKAVAAATLIAISGVASAGSVLIDDFSADQGPVSDTTPGDGGTVSTLGNRTISNNLLTGVAPFSSSTTVGFGILDIINGGGDDSEVILTWSLAPIVIPAGATNVQFSALILQSDGNPTTLEFLLDGNSLLSDSIPSNTLNQTVGFGVSAAALANGGSLVLKLNGAAGWDLSMDQFGISFTDPVITPTVPEPASLALFGLAALGAVAASRRRKA